MEGNNKGSVASFWEHLDVLRTSLMRVVVVGITAAIVAFFFKEQLFAIIFAPKSSEFITYQLLENILKYFGIEGADMGDFSIKLINTHLAKQFIVHMQMSLFVGFAVACPYIIFELYRFISPALYRNERRYSFGIVTSGYIMFLIGVAVSYFVIFPLTVRFLGTYQVSPEVTNEIVLSSYISMLMMLCVMMGIIFEIPIIGWLLAKLGVIDAKLLIKYRRHAVVVLLVLAALITPTSDVVTLLLVMIPMYVLYEFTILIIKLTKKKMAYAKDEEI